MNVSKSSGLTTAIKVLFYTMSILCIFTGLNYTFRGDLMPYHYSFLGRGKDQMDAKTYIFLISAMQIIGGLMFGLGGALGVMTRNLGKQAVKLLPVITVLVTPPLIISFLVVVRIGEFIPVTLVSILIVLFTAALITMYISEKKQS